MFHPAYGMGGVFSNEVAMSLLIFSLYGAALVLLPVFLSPRLFDKGLL